ncbi:Uncharacterised protein [uncultured archaeon]|nr:Uncharacterised protein [uncultured archaeon]
MRMPVEPGVYHCKLIQKGKGEMRIPDNIEIEHDEYVPMQPVSTRIVRIRIKSIERGQPYIL